MVVYVPNVSAAGQKYELKSVSSTVKDVLMENIGKKVIVQMDAGVNMEGIVSKVGKSLVHISNISGGEFYNAVVRIDKISAVLFKVRDN
jgi:prefoldin subunit 5